jgi:hypothetical protein
MVELTFREGVKLRRSLRSAFRSRSALAQVVFDQLHEDLGHIAESEDYGEVLLKLIVWAEANGRTADLTCGRTMNPGDDLLSEFEVEYQARRHGIDGSFRLPPRVLTQPQRQQLVDAVLLIPASDTYDGRSAFLLGLPASPSRIPNNARADLDTIFAQLDGLGRLDSGQWPLLLVIDNILPYAQGFEVHGIISQVKQSLEEAYCDH